MMVTKFDPTGATARGTLNNCGTGITPWGTLITCEENWATYFTMPAGSTVPTDAKLIASRTRYGVQTTATSATATTSRTQGWHTVTGADPTSRFARWNVSASGATAAADFRNEPHTFGYNVEIDPANVRLGACQTHGHGPLCARGCRLRYPRGRQALGLLHGLRFTQRIHLQICQRRKTGTQPTWAAALQQATSTSTRASCTLPSSTPLAKVSGWS